MDDKYFLGQLKFYIQYKENSNDYPVAKRIENEEMPEIYYEVLRRFYLAYHEK